MTQQEAKQIILDRQVAYRTLFLAPGAKALVDDLKAFCRATESCVDLRSDRLTHVLEGRREVWIRIERHLTLSPDELLDYYRLNKVTNVEEEKWRK